MKPFLLVIALIFSFAGKSQIIPVGTDVFQCPEDTISISPDNFDSSSVTVLQNVQFITLADDIFSPMVDIGFPFQFYDSVYTQLSIGSNGVLSFDTSAASGYCAWYIEDSIPTTDFHKNSILACYMDLIMAGYTTLGYETIGTAPNRRFVVHYSRPGYYNFFGPCTSISIILYETTNVIEVHLRDKAITLWNSSRTIQGLQNIDGTIAHPVPGRNYQDVWAAALDGKRWTPNGANSYAIEDIPFNQIITDTSGEYLLEWVSTSWQTFPFGDTLQIPHNDSLTGYFVGITYGEDCFTRIAVSDTSWIDSRLRIPSLHVLDDFCASDNGQIFSTDASSSDSNYFWNELSVYSDTLTDLPAGNYSYLFTGINGCETSDTVQISVQNEFLANVQNVVCPDDDNGSITLIPDIEEVTYTWPSPVSVTGSSIDGLAPGTYTCYAASTVGCSDTLEIEVGFISEVNMVDPILVNETCYGSDDGSYVFEIDGNASPFTIYLNFGLSDLEELNSLSAGQYQVHVVDTNQCSDHSIFTISSPLEILLSVSTVPEINGNDGEATITSANPGTFTFELNGLSQQSGAFPGLAGGTYTCVVTDQNNCQDSITFTIDSHLSLSENQETEFIASPNPFSETLKVEANENATYVLTDATGKICLLSSSSTGLIDTKSLLSGTYFLKELRSRRVARVVKL